jgi:hypothetical protein
VASFILSGSFVQLHQYFRVPADVRTSIEFQMRLVYSTIRRHGFMEPEIFLSVRQRRNAIQRRVSISISISVAVAVAVATVDLVV